MVLFCCVYCAVCAFVWFVFAFWLGLFDVAACAYLVVLVGFVV